MRLFPLALIALAILPGCSPITALNSAAPKTGYQVISALPYGEHPRQKLDLYIPDGTTAETPLVVFFYGGGWRSGSRADYLFVGEALASRGFIVAIPDYRLYPEVKFPAFVEDGASAVAHLLDRQKSPQTAGRPTVLAGHSAGAHTALMLTMNAEYLAATGVDTDRQITAAVGLSGPYDIAPIKGERLKKIFSQARPESLSQPITFARGDAPSVLLIHGVNDTTVLVQNSRNLAARIREQGGEVTLIEYPKIGHAPMVGAMAKPLRWLAPTLDDVTAFIDRVK